jgi:hypothetical protein
MRCVTPCQDPARPGRPGSSSSAWLSLGRACCARSPIPAGDLRCSNIPVPWTRPAAGCTWSALSATTGATPRSATWAKPCGPSSPRRPGQLARAPASHAEPRRPARNTPPAGSCAVATVAGNTHLQERSGRKPGGQSGTADTRPACAPMTRVRPAGAALAGSGRAGARPEWVHPGQRLRYGHHSAAACRRQRSRPQRQPSLRLLPARCGSMRPGRMRGGWQRSPASACARRLRSLIPAIPAGPVSGGTKEVPVAVLAGFLAAGPGV